MILIYFTNLGFKNYLKFKNPHNFTIQFLLYHYNFFQFIFMEDSIHLLINSYSSIF
jgi:hypothetical protein